MPKKPSTVDAHTLTIDAPPGHLELLDLTVRNLRASEAKLQQSEARFHSLATLSFDSYWEQDESLRFTQFFGSSVDQLGITADALMCQTGWDIPGVRWNVPERTVLEERLAAREPFRDAICSWIDADGARRHFQISGEPKFDLSGRFTGYRGIGNDVTDRVHRDDDQRRFRSAIDATADAIFLLDRATLRFTDVNDTACRMLGYSLQELLALGPMELGAGSRDYIGGIYDDLISGSAAYKVTELWLQRRDGSRFPVEIHRQAHRSDDGWTIVAVARDITERKEAEGRLRQLAHYDQLTGLPNRTLFYDSLKSTLVLAEQRHLGVGVLLIDLDRFKNVNDTLGHSTGDKLLRQVSQRLMKCVRAKDTIGRLGGDEFALILSDAGNVHSASIVANKVMRAFRQPFTLEGREVTMTASIGLTVYPTDALEADTLIKYADSAMYEAKDAGRNTFRFYTEDMNSRMLQKCALEDDLRRAIEHDEFVLYYQPKMQVDTGEWSGVEALIRWNRPGHGLVSPAVFVPALEETGLIVPVGAWVINAACRKISNWEHAGIGPIPVAVNVSGRQFLHEGLAATIEAAIRRYRIEPSLLEIEITESSLMSNAEHTVDVLQDLKALGIRISIDDFGTGYSSLAYLKRFPIDKLKIDIAFIRDVTTNEDDAAITTAIINMAHSLKLKVIAEGVETLEQLEFLRTHRCDEIQGYYFSRPLPAPELKKLRQSSRVGRSGGPAAIC